MFSAFHAGSTWQLLRARLIGTCTDVSPELLQDFRRLRADMQAARLFESSKLYYVWKSFTNLAICATSLSILHHSSSVAAVFVSAFLMVRALQPHTRAVPRPDRRDMQALFWQQCGWLSHDFLHHQARPNAPLVARRQLTDTRCVAGVLQPERQQRRWPVLWQPVPGAQCSCAVCALARHLTCTAAHL